MIQKGSRIRHRNPDIDKLKGVMIVFEIKNGFATCGYGDFARLGQGAETYLISDIKLDA